MEVCKREQVLITKQIMMMAKLVFIPTRVFSFPGFKKNGKIIFVKTQQSERKALKLLNVLRKPEN